LEYLEAVLVRTFRKIYAHPFSLLVRYSNELEREYADILDHVQQTAGHGDIIGLEKYVRGKVNGSFTKIIKNFLVDYERYKGNNN
jgi:hypothetical protein